MFIHKLKIGNVELENNLILAPMAGVTNKPFRIICKEVGEPGMVCTEMSSSRGMFHNDDKTKRLFNTEGEKRPISFQVFGSDEESLEYATKYMNNFADIIDINMGCPAPKVVKNGDGSKLLLDLEKARSIIKTVVDVAKVPVTLKIRMGWDKEHIVAVDVAKIAEELGISAITVHGRTRSEFYTGTADWDIIKKVKQKVKIPVIGNGDVKTPQDAKRILEQTGCDGIMVGRATLGKPWLIEQIQTYLKNGEIRKITNDEILQVILKHIELEIQEKGEYTGIREMRKHICYYLKGLPNASEVRDSINHMETEKEVKNTLLEYFKSINHIN